MTAHRPGIRPAFTLLELLAVIVIIGLLVALLVPAVSTIRTSAKRTSTSAALGAAIGTALETFKGEYHSYPPSASDSDGSNSVPERHVKSPYRPPAYPTNTPAAFDISGAGLLVWGLVGADRLGTPGFKRFRSASKFWSHDTDNTFLSLNDDENGAYALNRTDQQPSRKRSGLFLDLDRVQVSNFDERQAQFLIPAEVKARGSAANLTRPYPMFLDTFGFPILYWRADAGGRHLVDVGPLDSSTGIADDPARRGIFHQVDNDKLVRGNEALTLVAGAAQHKLFWLDMGSTYTAANPPPRGNFPAYIRDIGIKAKLAPQRADSYLLVSAGEDGVYGTGDDIANFSHNGQ